MLDKLKKITDTIGKQNVILIVFIIIVLGITALYQTFSIYTASEGVSIIDGIKTYSFILNASNTTNSVTIAANSNKYVAITVSNQENLNLKYGIYYSSSSSLTNVKLGYLSTSTYPANGMIEGQQDYTINIKINNYSSSNITINFGLSYGLENGGDLTLSTGKNWVEEYTTELLNTVAVGSYVAYVGSGGKVGSTSVACKTNGSASSTTATAETESPNSCSGQNAREDIDSNEGTYGYCYDSNYKYSVTGWRIAYFDSNGKTIIMSAGSPECNSRTESTANVNYIQTANAKALKYCNTDFVDGNCSCIDSNGDGLCDTASTDAWAISDTDFYYITKTISGVGKRLTDGSSTLGDSGGSLGTTLYCGGQGSIQECGYGYDILDNGGYYWFAAQYNSSSTNNMFWSPRMRSINSNTNTEAFGLRPVISLSSSVYITGGSGTMIDPYTIAND